jgi:hypothetical protein
MACPTLRRAHSVAVGWGSKTATPAIVASRRRDRLGDFGPAGSILPAFMLPEVIVGPALIADLLPIEHARPVQRETPDPYISRGIGTRSGERRLANVSGRVGPALRRVLFDRRGLQDRLGARRGEAGEGIGSAHRTRRAVSPFALLLLKGWGRTTSHVSGVPLGSGRRSLGNAPIFSLGAQDD